MKAKWIAVAAAAAVTLGPGVASAQKIKSKAKGPMVAVMDFEYGTVDNWWGQYDIGKGMADQVMGALLDSGQFRVIERKKIDAVLAEQDFSQSDRADPKTARKIGKALAVQYIVAGSITKFSTEKKNMGGTVKGIGLGLGKAKSEVNLTARLIDVDTGEVVASAEGHGESKKGGGFSFAKGSVGVGMNSPEFRQSALGDAQKAACEDIVKKFLSKIEIE
jgi:curli biogenesis system outer membrane secretion channel CsgG